jgi:integrase
MQEQEIIKSVRVYEEKGVIHLDYRVQTTAKLPKGKSGNRFRFSTNKKATKIAMNQMERQKHIFAAEHYYLQMDTLENRDEPTFEDVAYLALAEQEVNRRKTDGTKDYLNILERDVLPTFAKMKLQDIKPMHINSWQKLMGEDKISQSRYNKKHYVVNKVLEFSAKNDYISDNPARHVKKSSKLFAKPASNANAKDYFTTDEREMILNYICEGCSKRDLKHHDFILAFMHAAFLTGARTGEIMALKWSCIDFEKNLITFESSMRKGVLDVTKTEQIRVVPMVQRLREALLKWKGSTNREFVFPVANKGTPYKDSRSIVDTMFKPMLEFLNIKYLIMYSSRHTFSSLAIENGVSMTTVSNCLGHSNISTTQRYYVRMGNLDYDKSRAELESLAL